VLEQGHPYVLLHLPCRLAVVCPETWLYGQLLRIDA
jgi:hypothetical protein